MELALPFLRDLAKRLVPACEPDVVAAVLDAATSGYIGTRMRDGRKATWLTGSGVPFEACVTGGGGEADVALRFVAEAATGKPFFVSRLVDQRAVLDELIGWLPPAAAARAGELRRFVDLLFPDPAEVPARTRFATTFGFVHRAELPHHLARLKLYGNASVSPGALDRLAAAWAPFGELVERAAGIPDLRPTFAALELAADGELHPKLYLHRRGGDDRAVRLVADRFGVSLDGLDVPAGVWERPCAVRCAVESGQPPLSFQLSARGFSEDPTVTAGHAVELAERHHGSTVLVDALRDAAAADPTTSWRFTVFGFGLDADGVAKVNLYMAPEDRS